jgi:uncharacterized damage-inducible protein DinB
MTPGEMRLLYDFNSWANHRTLEAAAALSHEQFLKPLGSSFSSVRDTLAHIHGAEWIWLERFLGNSPAAMPEALKVSTVADLRERWRATEERLARFVKDVTQEALDTEMQYKTMAGVASRNPLWQSLQHLVNHGSYHRGQVTTMLRQLGAKAVGTDLITFYRERAQAGAA